MADCPECGAGVPEGGSCRDHFHTLLLLEAEIPGVPGSILHFYAVATYMLQHPDGMSSKAEALARLRVNLADALDGRATLDEVRRRARESAEGAKRVTRRAGEAPVSWNCENHWPMTVADVCTLETFGSIETFEEYADRVQRWARSVREVLDAGGA